MDMRVALRVLTAVMDGRKPELNDVELLERLAPYATAWPTDELACEVVHCALKRRVNASGRAVA